jgi:hypothetical protein
MNLDMNPPNVVLLIMNCVRYKDKADAQKKTWLAGMTEVPYYHVRANPEMEPPYQFDDTERVLWVKTKDDYNSLPHKVISAYQAVAERYAPTLKYVLKTDDDQTIQARIPNNFFQATIRMLERSGDDAKIHYAGNVVDVPQPYLSQYHRIHPELPVDLPVLQTKYCSGRFYVLSADAVADLLKKKHHIEKEFLEDYAIGLHLDESYKRTMKHLATNVFFQDTE